MNRFEMLEITVQGNKTTETLRHRGATKCFSPCLSSCGLFLFIASLFLSGCGNPGINLNNAPYNPKIVVEGYLYPGQTVSHISLMRNYLIGDSVTPSDLYLTPSNDGVTATISGSSLTFDPQTQTYYNNQIMVDYNKSYTLEVSATVDGKQLQTTSTTTTPQKGFRVLKSNLGTFAYGDSITIDFLPSPGTGFYAFSIVPDTASTQNFNYNSSSGDKLDSSKVAENMNKYVFHYGTVDNINSYAITTYSFNINSRNTWFYSSYTVVAYACDQNFKDYVLTAPSVQEVDGNFHEPIETFQGDGIGVFGSAIADTVEFSIVR